MLIKLFIILLVGGLIFPLWILSVYSDVPYLYDKIISVSVNGKTERFGIKIYHREYSIKIIVCRTIRHRKFAMGIRFLDKEIDCSIIDKNNVSEQKINNEITAIIKSYEKQDRINKTTKMPQINI